MTELQLLGLLVQGALGRLRPGPLQRRSDAFPETRSSFLAKEKVLTKPMLIRKGAVKWKAGSVLVFPRQQADP